MDCSSNIMLLADSYKSSHYLQYPPGTSHIYSYFESRGGKFPYTVFFGLQYILKKYLSGPVVTREKILEAKEIFAAHFGRRIFNEEGWNYILEQHGGYLPVRIHAVPEGSIIPTHNVLFTVENTDPNVPWLTSFLETILVQTWYPMTVATISRVQKQIIHKHMQETCDKMDGLDTKLHDFGFRGASSVESASLGGAAHLVNFKGSDTVGAISLVRKFYSCSMPSISVPAAEHSTITCWGKDGELQAYENMLNQFKTGIVSIVCDSYNVFSACEEIFGKNLKKEVIDLEKRGGLLALRLDSGDPTTIVLKALDILGKSFGTVTNSKGYKLLPPFLRILQGDGINYLVVENILRSMKESGWSADNVTFGSGGALLQKVDRDTQKCAYKCSYAEVDGKGVDVFKNPITDPGKKSKKGKLLLHKVEDTFITFEQGKGDPSKDILLPVFENGQLLKDYTFEEIRERAEISQSDMDPLLLLKR